MLKRAYLWIIIILCFGFDIMPLGAAYLTDYPTQVTQPDGSILDCLTTGDEYYHWLHDKDGYTIIQSRETLWYTYAIQSGESITAGSLIAGRDDPTTLGISPGVNISEAESRRLYQSRNRFTPERNAPTTGTINNLVVFIRFSDDTEYNQTFNSYSSWFNTGASSLKSYYQEVSYNQLTVNSTFYPAPSNGYVVSWQDSHPRSYYLVSDDEALQIEREFTLMENAVAGIASLVPANLVLDADNDGIVDNIVFIAKGNTGGDILWPHRWSIFDRIVTLRGKRVYDYNLQVQNHLATYNVGVLCHEFFHTLGAPDLYHYHNTRTPVGPWDLMAHTTNPPQHMSAYMKWKYGGWIAAPPLITGYGSYTLNPPTSQTGSYYRINSGISSTEYYIVEYRRITGLFDSLLPGSGLLVYRINSSVPWGNRDGPPDEVYIYRPDGTVDSDGLLDSAFYSLEEGRTAINYSTNPPPFLTNNANGGLSLFNIGSAGETISFYSGVPTPAQISWNPITISTSLYPNSSTQQSLTLSNLGDVTLNYYSSLPTATITVLDETFSTSSRPANWTEQQVSGTPLSWSFTSGGYNGHPPAAYDGSYNARLFIASHELSVTKLITPVLNLSGAVSASLSFWHTQGDNMNPDKLMVYYKTSLSRAWNLLEEYTGGYYSWTQETIPLPNICGTYYIAFEGHENYGYGVCLDKVVVTKTSTTTTPWVSLNGQTAVSGSLTGFNAQETITVGINTTGLSPGTHNSTLTITSNSVLNGNLQIPIYINVLTPQPQIAVSTTTMGFGTVLIDSFPSQTFQITNAGNATLSGNLTTPANFIVMSLRDHEAPPPADSVLATKTPTQRNSLAYSVLAGATNTYTVYFYPTALQAYSGTLTITHNAVGGNRTIALSGQGGKPTIGLSATTFSSNLEPGVLGNQTLTISNSGNLALSYTLSISTPPVWLRINGGTELSNNIAVGGASQNVTLNFNNTGHNPGTYTATIAGTSNDPSRTTFSISVTMVVPGTLSLYNPVGGEFWEFGSVHPITFSYTGTQSSVLFLYSTNGGSTWISLGSKAVVPGANSFNWVVPSTPSDNCKIRLVENIAPYYQAKSNVFAIISTDPPSQPQNVLIGRHPVIPGLAISWQASTGYFNAYAIYFCSEPDGRYSLLSSVAANQTSYVDDTAFSRSRGFYKVIAVRY